MDYFVSVLLVASFLGVGLYMAYRRNERERKANPVGPFVLRATVGWNNAPADMRNLLLKEVGVDSEPKRNLLIIRPWNMLDGDVQIALTKLQLIAESTASNAPNLTNLQARLIRERDMPGSEKATVSPVLDKSRTKEPQTVPYFDSFMGLAMRLSRSIPIPDWATGTPQSYSLRESMSVDLVRVQLENTTFKWLAEQNGGTGVSLSPHVEEPLQKLLAEIGLIRFARELTHESHEKWDDDLPSEELGAIISTYLKAWLCNSSPFVLLELADFLGETGRAKEAGEAVNVALMFPAYAKTMTMSDMGMVAQTLAYELFPPGPGRDARSLSKGLFSPKALAILDEEVERIQRELDGIQSSGSHLTND